MLLLAVDTATQLCSACLYDSAGAGPLSRRSEDVERRHAERLLPMIEEILAESGRAFSDLQRLAVCVGPGSFTGLRVGVAAMRGLALALDRPLIGVSVFDVLARAAAGKRPVLVVLDARRGEIYSRLYAGDGREIGAPCVLTPGQAAALARREAAVLTGSGSPLVAAQDASLPVLETTAAVDIALLAELAAARVPGDDPPVPLYLRAPDAKPQVGFAIPRRRQAS